MNKHQRHKTLLPVRLAIKGWVFWNAERRPAMVQRAIEEKCKLPRELWAEADALIAEVDL